MSDGVPVLGMVNGSSNKLISEAKCGYVVVSSGNYRKLASIIISKILNDKESFEALGYKDRNYYKKNFTKECLINNLCEIFKTN